MSWLVRGWALTTAAGLRERFARISRKILFLIGGGLAGYACD